MAASSLRLGGLADDAHRGQCRLQHCPRCTWVKNKVAWRQKTGDWLCDKVDLSKGTWGIGCALCASAASLPEMRNMKLLQWGKLAFVNFEVAGTLASPLKVHRFIQHQRCPGHKAAVAFLQAGHLDETQHDALPSEENWRKVYHATLSGNPTSVAGVYGVGCGRKVRRMQWCLAEAKRTCAREALRRSLCIAIAQDKRNTRFLLRFRCVDEHLNVHEGVMCLAHDVNSVDCAGADGLRRATLRGIEHICTPTKAPGTAGPAPAVDQQLFNTVVVKVESFAADGAADEQLAGRELASRLSLAGPAPMEIQGTLTQSLPGLKAPPCLGACSLSLFPQLVWLCRTLRKLHSWRQGSARRKQAGPLLARAPASQPGKIQSRSPQGQVWRGRVDLAAVGQERRGGPRKLVVHFGEAMIAWAPHEGGVGGECFALRWCFVTALTLHGGGEPSRPLLAPPAHVTYDTVRRLLNREARAKGRPAPTVDRKPKWGVDIASTCNCVSSASARRRWPEGSTRCVGLDALRKVTVEMDGVAGEAAVPRSWRKRLSDVSLRQEEEVAEGREVGR